MSDLASRLNAAIQTARGQVEDTNSHSDALRWREILWVLSAARDELNRKPTLVLAGKAA